MTAPRLSPRSMALAYRIWAFATPLEWDCDAREIASALDVDTRRVVSVLRFKGWSHRVRRCASPHTTDLPGSLIRRQDEALDALDGGRAA